MKIGGNNQSSMLPIDWSRAPRDDKEKHWCHKAMAGVMDFLLSMEGVADKYRSLSHKVMNIISPVILGLWDGVLTKRTLIVRKDSDALQFSASMGIDWGLVSTVINILDHRGFVTCSDLTRGGDGQVEVYVFGPTERFAAELEDAKKSALDHSQLFDVHTWSDHPEANAFVDHVYEDYFKDGKATRKKHLKVVLLDLFVRWKTDPSLKTAIFRGVNAYEPGSRYNALHISKTTVPVLDRLIDANLIHQAKGFFDRSRQTGKTTRIWPSGKLAKMFDEARFGVLDVANHADREVVVLRDAEGKDIEYEDTPATVAMRAVLKSYNELLHRTFIDIPTLEDAYIPAEDGSGKILCYVSQRDKFVRRVFNRGSFDKGGRFYGGWWQNCPKEWRDKIFIDDKPTSELDYSGLHIVLLYARNGVDYWQDGSDPYVIDFPDFEGTVEELRHICKQLLLVAINAKDENSTFHAFRSEAKPDSPEKHMSNKTLSRILGCLKERHRPIADMIANDAAIDLMRTDSDVAEAVIAHFTQKGVPVLAIHDSFIVQHGYKKELDDQMQKAFQEAAKGASAKIKEVSPLPSFILWSVKKRQDLEKRFPRDDQLQVADITRRPSPLDTLATESQKEWVNRTKPKRTKRYQAGLREFRSWLSSRQGQSAQ